MWTDIIDTFGGLRKAGESPEEAIRRLERKPSPEYTAIIGTDEGQRLLEAATDQVEMYPNGGLGMNSQEREHNMAIGATGPAPKPEPRSRGKATPAKATPAAKAPAKANGKATAKAATEGPLCLCGCGEHTKGGKFRPGHDARYHSAQKKLAEAKAAKGK